MNIPSADRTCGSLLRSLRQASGMEVSELARLVNLSSAQVLQLESNDLEPGQRSLFYTPAIQQKAALKVAKVLGADLNVLNGAPQEPSSKSAPFVQDLQILDDLASLLRKQSQAKEMTARASSFSWKWVVAVFSSLWLAGAIGYYGQGVTVWLNAPHSAKIDLAPAVSPAAEPPSEPLIVSAVPQPVASEGVLDSADITLVNADALCDSKAVPFSLTASQPTKYGHTVHVVAVSDLVICARDGSGKIMSATLKAQESRTFVGKAPWSLHIQNPNSLHMFFQGQKIYWPEGGHRDVVLKEVSGNF
jgi:transcriptional regulator with XRE-family HTH domain